MSSNKMNVRQRARGEADQAIAAAKPTIRARRGGMPRFEPTDEQRRAVELLAGLHMNWDELTQLIRNPRTHKPISKETLQKVFKQELAAGNARLKAMVGTAFVQSLTSHDPHVKWRATEWAMQHLLGFREDRLGMAMSVGVNNGPNEMKIRFLMPELDHERGIEDELKAIPAPSKRVTRTREDILDLQANRPSPGVPLIQPRKPTDWMK